jgi:hypothetical protein
MKRAGRTFLEVRKDCILVGFVRKSGDPELSDYRGPTAEISFDGNWLNIITDEHEGAAMLNIETLPRLRRALAIVAKQIRDAKKPSV